MFSKHHLKASVGIALVAGAFAAPAASAYPPHGPTAVRQDKQVVVSAHAGRALDPSAFSRQDKQVTIGAPATTPVASIPRPAAPVATSGGGFDWGDAGIGAAGGLVLSIAGLGTALVVMRRRPGAPRTSAPVTS